MNKLICNVCNTNEAKGVACSQLGAVSFAYCQSCLELNAEPYGALVGTIAMCGGKNKLAQWMYPIIEGSLKVADKTHEELDRDVERSMKEFDDWCNIYEEAEHKTDDVMEVLSK